MEFGAVAVWLALSLALIAVGVPIASTLFPRLADRGASVALPLALLVVGLVSFWIGRISLLAGLAVAILGLVAGAILAIRRGVEVNTDATLEVAAVFTLAFLVMVGFRAADPAIIPLGGEKFLDFGLLKALLRTDTVPPEDFWYAGEPMMYYYGGHMIVAQLVRLTNLAPSVAYNLAVASFFATYVTAAYGLAGNVAARRGAFARRAAVLGAFFVGIASTLVTPLRVLLRPLPDGLAEAIAKALGIWTGRFGSEGAIVTDATSFSMWDATGVVRLEGENPVSFITETPLFAFVNGDLHAHMMAPAFTLLAATALLAMWRTPPGDRGRRRFLLFGLVPAIAGLLAFLNTWSFPSIAGLAVLAVALDGDASALLPSGLRERFEGLGRLRSEIGRVGLGIAAGLAVGVLGLIWSLPFWLANVSGRTLGVLPHRASLGELVAVHGGFLLPIGLYVAYLGWARFDLSRWTIIALAGSWLVLLALTEALTVSVLGLILPLLLGSYLLGSRVLSQVRTDDDDAESVGRPGFEFVLILGALGLILLVEFVFVVERAAPDRFNTIFKVYAQVWALFAVGAAVAIVRLLRTAAVRKPIRHWQTLVRAFVVVLVVALSIYGVMVVDSEAGPLLDDPGRGTLDGTAHLSSSHPEEVAAIEWLDDREGTPTMVSKPGEVYQWAGGPSALTGVPTVIAWKHHELGWGRNWSAIQEREADVDTIYTGNRSAQRRLLAKYDVELVYVGPLERSAYGAQLDVAGLAGLEPAAEFDAVTIYRVDESIRENE